MDPARTTSERTYFIEEEVRALLGKRYRATAGYASVPPGTIGKVVDFYGGSNGLFGIDIEWQGVKRSARIGAAVDERHKANEPLRDGFSRDDLLVVFTGGAHKGERAMVPLDGGL